MNMCLVVSISIRVPAPLREGPTKRPYYHNHMAYAWINVCEHSVEVAQALLGSQRRASPGGVSMASPVT